MKRETHIFLTAVLFYTRIPCPKWVDHDPEYTRESARYFSLIGWIVGSIGALVFWSTHFIFTTEIAIVLSMFSTVWATGGFHEDGLADVCDGFGGGWTKEKILLIMKDSRLGTFGVLGLIIIFLLKFLSLSAITTSQIPFAIIAAHVFSRTVAARMLARGNYVQNNNNAKAGSAASKLSPISLIMNLLIGFSVFLLFDNVWTILVIFPMFFMEIYLYRFYKKWIGGYNGDCAGTVQQITEIIFYLGIIALWKFI